MLSGTAAAIANPNIALAKKSQGHPFTITALIAKEQKTASLGDHAIIQIGADQ